ncbi:MAG: hypothetical protein FWD74_12720 [Actinomycetia bacterium]|nr:hypothetical protein [Actinomycetes bacterium]
MARKTLDRALAFGGLALAVILLIAGGLLTWGNSFAHGQVKKQLSREQIMMPSGAAIASLPDADQAALKPFAKDGNNLMDTGAEAEAYADHYIAVHMRVAGEGLIARATALGVTEIPGKNGAPATPMPEVANYANASNVVGALTAAAADLPAPAAVTCAVDATDATKINCTPKSDPTAAPTTITCTKDAQGADKATCLTTLANDITTARTATFFTGDSLRGMLLNAYAWDTVGTVAGVAALVCWILGGVLALVAAFGFVRIARDPARRVTESAESK